MQRNVRHRRHHAISACRVVRGDKAGRGNRETISTYKCMMGVRPLLGVSLN